MKSCPEYKDLIDRYLDLDGSDAAELAGHLLTCSGCSEYKADADKTMKLLREFRRRMATVDPLDRAFDRLSSRLKSSRRQVVWTLALVATCITAPFAMAVRGELTMIVAVLLLFAGAGSGFLAWWGISRDQSAMVRLTKRGDGFYETWRLDLERRIRMTTGGAVFVSVWCIAFLFAAVFVFSAPEEQFVVLSAAFLLGAGALHTFFVELPELKDELALVLEASSG